MEISSWPLQPKPLLVTFGIAVAYLAVITVALRNFDIWTLKQFKITVLWFAFAGVPALGDVPKLSKNPYQIKAVIAKNFRLSLLFDFFINLFKLPLLVELIFVPGTALLGILLAVAESDEKYRVVKKFLSGVMVFIGLCVMIFVGYRVVTSYGEIANVDTLRDFSLPILYNLAFVPLLWVMAIYVAYESVFCRLTFLVSDSALHAYARRELVRGFRTDTVALNAWFKAAWSGTFSSRDDIAQSIAAFSRARTKP
ncbi:hypothetical protein [Cupriavidus taiwanensis]|uniref:hypothetical protein n=1 Tax=Cupriavidus taiwanensis TaxID=164546 RepID=UPI0039C0A09D